jgi:hypothetical protein
LAYSFFLGTWAASLGYLRSLHLFDVGTHKY